MKKMIDIDLKKFKSATSVYKEYSTNIQYDEEEKIFYGKIEFIEDLYTFQGKTIEEACINFEKMVDEYIKDCKKYGKEIDKPNLCKFETIMTIQTYKAIQYHAKNVTNNVSVESVSAMIDSIVSDYLRKFYCNTKNNTKVEH